MCLSILQLTMKAMCSVKVATEARTRARTPARSTTAWRTDSSRTSPRGVIDTDTETLQLSSAQLSSVVVQYMPAASASGQLRYISLTRVLVREPGAALQERGVLDPELCRAAALHVEMSKGRHWRVGSRGQYGAMRYGAM